MTNKWGLGIGDWGLGIGDWAQSPIPNPQTFQIFEILKRFKYTHKYILYYILNNLDSI